MKPHKRLLHAALLFIAVLTGLSLWLVHTSVPPSVASQLQRGGSLRVGFAVEVPYAYVDAQGQVTGEAPVIDAPGAIAALKVILPEIGPPRGLGPTLSPELEARFLAAMPGLATAGGDAAAQQFQHHTARFAPSGLPDCTSSVTFSSGHGREACNNPSRPRKSSC